MSASEATKRTWIALGLAEVLFAVAYPACAALAVAVAPADAHDGWEPLGLMLKLFVAGVFAVVVGVPIGVHTVGRLTAAAVEGRPPVVASSAHLAVGLALGAVAGAVLAPVASIDPAVALIACAIPTGIVGMGTNLLMPLAVRHAWVRVSAWALGAVPVLGGLALIAALGLRGVS